MFSDFKIFWVSVPPDPLTGLWQLPHRPTHQFLNNAIDCSPTSVLLAMPVLCSTHNMCADMTYLDILVSGRTEKQQETFNIRILGFRECSTVKWFILSE